MIFLEVLFIRVSFQHTSISISLIFFVVLGIDTDKYKYPIGSGRVTFDNQRSYMKAVGAAFIEIKTAKFTKKVGQL